MMPLEFVGCIGGCDETLRQVLDLKYLLRPAGPGGGGAVNPPPPSQRPSRPPLQRPSGTNPRPSLPGPPSWAAQPRPPPGGAGANSDVIVCNCGQDAVLLTVRKDGPNQGRQFYKCGAGSCNFFLWSDQPSQQGAPQQARGPPLQAPQASQPPRYSSAGSRSNSSNVGQVTCNCSEAAVTRTVQKDGPNKGRTFFTCGRPREQQCGFFQWADENAPPPGQALRRTDAHMHTPSQCLSATVPPHKIY